MLQGYVSAFPDNRFEVKNTVAAGDQVVMEGDWVGTHRGPLPLPGGQSIPATGRAVRSPFVTVFRVREGRIVSHRVTGIWRASSRSWGWAADGRDARRARPAGP